MNAPGAGVPRVLGVLEGVGRDRFEDPPVFPRGAASFVAMPIL